MKTHSTFSCGLQVLICLLFNHFEWFWFFLRIMRYLNCRKEHERLWPQEFCNCLVYNLNKSDYFFVNRTWVDVFETSRTKSRYCKIHRIRSCQISLECIHIDRFFERSWMWGWWYKLDWISTYNRLFLYFIWLNRSENSCFGKWMAVDRDHWYLQRLLAKY